MAAYYTADDLRRAAGAITASAAGSVLSREAKSNQYGRFDIFLSHSFHDAILITGLRNILQGLGLTVYVDWIDDPELDRSKVSAATADRLRGRMNQSTSLVFATSRASSKSKWMPWELGYFDGEKGPDRVSICPIETNDSGSFVGQEYLGLYKTIEKVRDGVDILMAAVHPAQNIAEDVRSFGRKLGNYYHITRSA
ncbi:hypothetical protein [Nocardia sp. NPDC004750]